MGSWTGWGIPVLPQDDDLSRTMVRSARAFMTAHYSWEKTVAESDRLYTNLLAETCRCLSPRLKTPSGS